MNDDEDADVHMCLVCQSTITGLLNYVHHKKNECSGRKTSKDSLPLQSQASYAGDSTVTDFGNSSFALGASSASYLGPSYNSSSQQTFALTASGQNPGFVDSVLSTQATIGNSLDEFDPVHFPTAGGDNVGTLNEMFCTTIQQNVPANPTLFDTNRAISSHQASGDILASSLNLSPVFSSTSNGKTTDRNDDHGILSACVTDGHAGHYARGDYSSSDNIPIHINYPLSKNEKNPSESSSINININEIMSENTNKDHDSHMKSATEKVDNFFQSLELMSKNDPRVEKGSNQPLLPISTFLNNLTFSSDEEDLSFNFADDVSFDSLSDESDQDQVPSNRVGGKWKPGDRPTAAKRNRPMFRGKWPPGQAPAETKKKYYGSRPTGGKNILALKQVIKGNKPSPKMCKSKKARTCNICQVTFENRFKYSNHCGSKQHKEKVFGKRESIPANFARGKGKSVRMYPDVETEKIDNVVEANDEETESHEADVSREATVVVDTFNVDLSPLNNQSTESSGGKTRPETNATDFVSTKTEAEEDKEEMKSLNKDVSVEITDQETDIPGDIQHTDDKGKPVSLVKSEEVEKNQNAVEAGDGNEIDVSIDPVEGDDEQLVAVPLYICTVCDKKYDNKYLLAQHLISKYHRNRAVSAPMESYQLLQQYHKYIIRFSPYQCAICRYYFNSHAGLESHLQDEVHTNNCSELFGEILCTLCTFKTRSQQEFQEHVRSEGHKANVLKRRRICVVKECHVKCHCKYCGLQMQSYTRMKHHIQIKHKDGNIVKGVQKRVIGQRTRPFCSECNKTFASPSAYDLHCSRLHSTEKKYNCDICKAKFSGKHALRSHEKTLKHLNNLLDLKLVKLEGENGKASVNIIERKQESEGKQTSNMMVGNTFAESRSDIEVDENDDTQVIEQELRMDENDENYQYQVLKVEKEVLPTDKSVSSETVVPDVKVDDRNSVAGCIQGVSPSGEGMPKRRKKKRRKSATPTKVPTNKIFKCDHCPFTVTAYNDLRPHYMQEHSGKIKICEICDLVFLSDKALKLHVLSKEHQDNISRSDTTSGGSQFFECHICKKKFTDEKYSKFHTAYKHFHVSTEDEVLAAANGFDVTREKYKKAIAEAEEMDSTGSIGCPECGNLLKKNNFVEHLRIHTGDKPFKCKICPKEFASNVTLRRHLLGHFGCLECTCEVCGKEFKKITSLDEHMKVHEAEKSDKAKQHTCDTCGQSFYFETQLQKHLRRHKAREFACEVPGCHWKFVFRNELKHHMLSHEQQRPFLCDICGYAAATKYRLRRHHRTHTGERKYHCEYCTYKAGNSTHLHRHMRIHIGSKPFKCPYCDYACNTHENIRKHILQTKKHKGKTIYPCKFCEYGTNNSNEYRNHIIEAHRDQLGEDFHIDALSIFTGLYDKGQDPKKPEEGARIISVKERNSNAINEEENTKSAKKSKKKNPPSEEYFSGKDYTYRIVPGDRTYIQPGESMHSTNMTKSPKSMAAITLMNLAATVPGLTQEKVTSQEIDSKDVVLDQSEKHLTDHKKLPQLSHTKASMENTLKDYIHLSTVDLPVNTARHSSGTGLAYTHLTPPVDTLLKPSLFTPGSHFTSGVYAGFKSGMLEGREPRRFEELEDHHGATFMGGLQAERVSQAVMTFHNYSDQTNQRDQDPRDALIFGNGMQPTTR